MTLLDPCFKGVFFFLNTFTRIYMNVISNPETKMSTLVHEVNNNLRLKYTTK